MAYSSVYSDPRFALDETEPEPGTLGPQSLRGAGIGALAGLTPTMLRRLFGRKTSGRRTALETGGGAALGALLPLLASWKFQYQGPQGQVKSWDDLRYQLNIPNEKRSSVKQAALPVLAALPWLLKAMSAGFAAHSGYKAHGMNREAKALQSRGLHDQAANLRKARNTELALGALSAGSAFIPAGWLGRMLPGARAAGSGLKALPAVAGKATTTSRIASGLGKLPGAQGAKQVFDAASRLPGAKPAGRVAKFVGVGTALNTPYSVGDAVSQKYRGRAYQGVYNHYASRAGQPLRAATRPMQVLPSYGR